MNVQPPKATFAPGGSCLQGSAKDRDRLTADVYGESLWNNTDSRTPRIKDGGVAMTTVLLVSQDPQIAQPIADELWRSGDNVMWCRGPQDRDYECAAGRSGRCAYTLDADVVVVDGWLASDEHGEGITSWRLVEYYGDLGIPVVALAGSGARPSAVDGPEVVTLPRRTPAAAVVKAVGAVSAERRGRMAVLGAPIRRRPMSA